MTRIFDITHSDNAVRSIAEFIGVTATDILRFTDTADSWEDVTPNKFCKKFFIKKKYEFLLEIECIDARLREKGMVQKKQLF